MPNPKHCATTPSSRTMRYQVAAASRRSMPNPKHCATAPSRRTLRYQAAVASRRSTLRRSILTSHPAPKHLQVVPTPSGRSSFTAEHLDVGRVPSHCRNSLKGSSRLVLSFAQGSNVLEDNIAFQGAFSTNREILLNLEDGFYYNKDGIRHTRHGVSGSYLYVEAASIGVEDTEVRPVQD